MKNKVASVSDAELRKQTNFLGHPKGIGILSFMQLCNSYANYGMSAVLIYYLYKAVPEGLGLSQTNAAQLISLYSACSMVMGVIGSYMADRVIGPRRALRYNRIIQAIAYAVLAIPGLGLVGYTISQCLLLVANMCAGRSLEALVGKFYEKSDSRRDGAFTITYVISNIGAAAPVISGMVALAAGYHGAFALCAVFAALGALSFIFTENKFFGTIGAEPDVPVEDTQKKKFLTRLTIAVVLAIVIFGGLLGTGTISISTFANTVSTAAIFVPVIYFIVILRSSKTAPEERRHVLWLIPAFICNCVSLMVWYQGTSILAIYADVRVNRVLFGIEITPAAFQTIPAILAIFFGSTVLGLWNKMGKKQPLSSTKEGLGTIFWGCGPLLMVIPYLLYPADVKVSPLWLIGFYVLIILGEALNSPVGYSCASLVAPKAFAAQMVTVWSLSQSTGAALSSLVVNFYHEGSEATFFLAIGTVTCIVGALAIVFRKKIATGMGLLNAASTEQ